ncbi:WD40 repeat domain-containing protein, partial [bacterium]
LPSVKSSLPSGENMAGPAMFSPDGKLLFTLGKVREKAEPGKKGQMATYTQINGKTETVFETTKGKLWDVATGKLLWTLPETNDGVEWSKSVNTATFSADGKLMATKARYGPVHLWETSTGKLLRTLAVPFINMDALAFSPDGKTLAGGGHRSVSYQGEIILWDVESGDLQRSLVQPDSVLGTQIRTIAFSPNGKVIAVGGGAGKYESINEGSGRFNAQFGIVQLWDVKSGIYLSNLGRPVHRNLVTKMAFSPDGTRLATGSFDNTIGLWDTRTYMLQAKTACYGTPVKAADTANNNDQKLSGVGIEDLTFSRDGKTLRILNHDKAVRSWDVSAPKPQSDSLRRLIPGSNASYASLAFGPNGRWLVSGEHSRQVRFWKTDNQEETASFVAHNDPVNVIALAPLGMDEPRNSGQAPLLATGSNRLQWKNTGENSASGYNDGFEVKLWNAETHELQHTFSIPNYSVTSLAVSPRGRWVAAAGIHLGPLPLNSVAGGGVFGTFTPDKTEGLKPEELDQKKTAVVMIWDALTGELKQKYDLTGDILTDLKFSPDGNLLAADGNEMGVTLWSTVTGEKIHTLDDERRPLKPGESRTTEYFGSVEGKPTLAFTADGKHFARSHSGVVKFW